MNDRNHEKTSDLIRSKIMPVLPSSSSLTRRGLDDIAKLRFDVSARRIIIIADDDKTFRDALGEYCTLILPDKYEIILTESGEEALECFSAKENQVAAIVTDNIMAGIEGQEVIEKVYEKNPTLPAILISGYTTYEGFLDLSISRQPNCRFFKKPAKFENIINVLLKLIDFASGSNYSLSDNYSILSKTDSNASIKKIEQTLAEKFRSSIDVIMKAFVSISNSEKIRKLIEDFEYHYCSSNFGKKYQTYDNKPNELFSSIDAFNFMLSDIKIMSHNFALDFQISIRIFHYWARTLHHPNNSELLDYNAKENAIPLKSEKILHEINDLLKKR